MKKKKKLYIDVNFSFKKKCIHSTLNFLINRIKQMHSIRGIVFLCGKIKMLYKSNNISFCMEKLYHTI